MIDLVGHQEVLFSITSGIVWSPSEALRILRVINAKFDVAIPQLTCILERAALRDPHVLARDRWGCQMPRAWEQW